MKIVCLGDSLTAGYNVTREESWVDLLNRETPDMWINAGISGDTSMGMLVRLRTEVLAQKPDMVLYMGGDNDIMITGSTDQAKSVVMAVLHQCAEQGIRPVLGIPMPILDIPQPWQEICDLQQTHKCGKEYVDWLRQFTATLSLRKVDFAAAFCESETPRELYLADGMHPSPKGHRIMAEAVKRAFYH